MSAAGEPIAGSIALSDGHRRATFTSAATLAADTVHTVSLSTRITDPVGNPLDNPASVRFRTGQTGDVARPQVTAVEPADAAVAIPLNARARVAFSEPVNPLTVTPATFFIENAQTGAPVAGTVAVAADGLSATFTPNTPLAPLTRYRVQTTSAITDLAGNSLLPSFALAVFATAGQQTPPS